MIAHVGEQLDLNTTIFSTTGSGVVAGYLLILADSDQIKLVRRNAVLGLEVVCDCVGSTLAELIIVVGISDRICPSGQCKNVPSSIGEMGCHIVELLFVVGGQDRLIETERDGYFGELLVVIEICDDSAQAVDAVICLLRRLVRCIGRLTRS